MAVDFKVQHTRTSEYLFLPQDIKFNPALNGRHELPDIDWLVKSMVATGQISPVLIRNDGGVPVLIAGFSRWRAATEINKKKLTPEPFKLRCVYFRASEQEGFLANVSENLERNSTTAIDDGHNMARMERYGMSVEAIAQFYHPKDELGNLFNPKAAAKWVKERLSYVSLSSEAIGAVKAGKVKPNAVAVLAKMSEEAQRAAVKSGEVITAVGLKAKATTTKAEPPVGRKNGKIPHYSWAVKQAIQNVLDTGALPNGLAVAQMTPEDAIHAFAGVLMDMLEGKK